VFVLYGAAGAVLADSSSPYTHVSLQLQWKYQYQFAGFFAAKEKGFFREAGLDVEIREYQKGLDVIGEVVSGRADFGVTSGSIIPEYFNGKPLFFMANFLKQSPLALITQPEITSLESLRGKKVMGIEKSPDSVSLLHMLHKFGISLHDIVPVPVTFTIDAFQNREVAARSIFKTNEMYYLNKAGIKYNIFSPAAYGMEDYENNLFTTQKMWRTRPEQVQRFREACIKGWEYTLEHREEMVDLILDRYNTQQKSREALLFEAKLVEQMILPLVHPVGSIEESRIRMIAEEFMQAGYMKAMPPNRLAAFYFHENPKRIVLTKEEKAFLKAHPRIVLGTDKSWHPYVIVGKDGNITGYDADVLALINRVSGSGFTLQAGAWKEMQEKAQKRQIDGLSTGAAIASRKHYVNFSDVYSTMSKMVMVESSNPEHIHTLEDLEGKTIALHRGNLADEKTARQFPKSNFIYFDTVEAVLKAVASGKADAMFANGSTLFYANELGLPYLKKIAVLPDKLELVFSIRNDWPEAVSIVNKALKAIGEDTLKALQHKWFWKEEAQPLVPHKMHLTAPQKLFLESKKEIRYCIDPDWMPLEAIRSGMAEGMVSEMIPLFAERVGIPFRLFPTSTWDDTLFALKEGMCDVSIMMMPTRRRSRQYHFTTPYLHFPVVVATTNDKSFISDIRTLSKEKIGVVKNYVFKELMERDYPHLRLIEVNSVKEGLEAVRDGALFGLIDNLYVLGYQIQKYFPSQLKISGKMKDELQLSIAISKKEPKLFPVMQQLVDSLEPGTLEKITGQWLRVTYTKEADYTLLWKTVLVILVLGVFLLYRQYMLYRYNRQLQAEVERQVEELRKKDEILVSKLRMAAMGEMLSMIAHQWRQPLSAVSNTMMMIDLQIKMKKHDFESREGREAFFAFFEKKQAQVTQYLSYLSHTIDDFKDFFKPDKQMEQVAVTEPLERALLLLSHSLEEKGIRVAKTYATEEKIKVVSNEIMQVILNILKNSEYNFKEKGVENPRIDVRTEKEGNRVKIVLCDNGGGIPEHIMGHIFDPYYTTKDEINGTGLGLYMSKMMIEEHHGGALLVSNTEEGVCFTLLFPAAASSQV